MGNAGIWSRADETTSGACCVCGGVAEPGALVLSLWNAEPGVCVESAAQAARLGLSLGDMHQCQACAVRNGAVLPGVCNG